MNEHYSLTFEIGCAIIALERRVEYG
jgi:hypothetical protein